MMEEGLMRLYASMADFGDSAIVATIQNTPMITSNNPGSPAGSVYVSPFSICVSNAPPSTTIMDLRLLWKYAGQSTTQIGVLLGDANAKYSAIIAKGSWQSDSGNKVLAYSSYTTTAIYETGTRHGTDALPYYFDNIICNRVEVNTLVNNNIMLNGTIVIYLQP